MKIIIRADSHEDIYIKSIVQCTHNISICDK